jgi:RIO kinase 1
LPVKTFAVEALETFLDEGLIDEVIGVVKSGKEATVYSCRAGEEYVAAKVYRPRHLRSFKNDAVYQDGRVILDKRVRRAVQKMTRKGREFHSAMWIGSEFETLTRLYAAGADVPRPISCAESAILMEFIGEEGLPARMLGSVDVDRREADVLFDQMVRNVRLWLRNNVVHGDLSPYNILYRPGQVTVIDFPQAVDPRFNTSAYDLLLRDVEHVCDYFAQFGVRAHPARIAREMWIPFTRDEL